MPRIRTIKPEFPQSETIGRLSREARLLFLQLFTLVDDAGRARAAPRMLASLLYPYDDDAAERIDGWLAELDRHGLVVCYAHGGARYLAIAHWTEHQRIDRPTPSRLPPPPGDEPREASRVLAPDQDLDLESESGPGTSDASARGFDEFWKAYPRRAGANPREPARRKFAELVAAGVDPGALITAAKRLAAEHAANGTSATRFVPQAITYLAQGRFADEALSESAPARELDITEAVKLYARTGHWSRFAGPAPGLTGCRATSELLASFGLSPDGRAITPASLQKEGP